MKKGLLMARHSLHERFVIDTGLGHREISYSPKAGWYAIMMTLATDFTHKKAVCHEADG